MRRLMTGLAWAVATTLLLVQGAAAAGAKTTFKMDGDVMVLDNPKTFDAAIKEHDLLLVKFYAPWCGHCKKLAPEFEKAAAELKKQDPHLHLAKVDSSTPDGADVAKPFDVTTFPTLLLFKKGEPRPYGAGRTAEDIVHFMLKRAGPAWTVLATPAEAEAFIAQHPKVAVGFFDALDSDKAQAFHAFADNFSSQRLAVAVAKDVLSKYGAKAGEVKHFLGGKLTATTVPDFTAEDAHMKLATWIYAHSLPLLAPYDSHKVMLQSGPIKVHLLAFLDPAAKAYPQQHAAVATAVGKRRTEVVSAAVGQNNTNILQAFGVDPATDFPALAIADVRGGAARRYVFRGDLAKTAAVEAFVADFFAGKLQPHLKSEEPAADDLAKPVKVIKGKTFKKEVLDSDKDVFIKFYAPWCSHCQKLAPKWEQLAEALKDVKHIAIAKIDATANEIGDVPGVEVLKFPTLYFFRKGRKGKPLPFWQERTVDNMIKFLRNVTSTPFELEEVKVGKDEL